MNRFNEQQVATWRKEGGVLIEKFFTDDEVAAVRADFDKVFGRTQGGAAALSRKNAGEIGRFDGAQFATFDAIPFSGAHALNLIGVHPQLIKFARAALDTQDVHLYQCQAWAKFTGDADYDQPFHCDFINHTLTVPSEDAGLNSATIICYFTDVSEAHGPMHYVKRTDSDPLGGATLTLSGGHELQTALMPFEQTSAAPAGSIFPYGIDVFHRGTNMSEPGGVRYAVMACYKKAGDESIGYHAWPFHHMKPWNELFARATPEQLSCFGVQPPGHPFWTQATLEHAQQRYPDWDLSPYHDACGS
ncbi:MAG: hypothetical protein NXH95_07205 [Pseudomonadaceae bacterium]|nr:hypothetical protein [Pseudomonadaceae bacterium]